MSKRILVVGDWLIDEYWVVGEEITPTASRPGKYRFHSLHGREANSEALGGAGMVASVLGAHEEFEVHGLGVWDLRDTPYLSAMMSEPEQRLNPYRATRGPRQATTDSNLHNAGNEKATTNRMVRLYVRGRETDVDLLSSVDWEKAPPQIDWPAAIEKLPAERWDAIVVKDLADGVVCKELIAALVSANPGARWYLSSKKWHLKPMADDVIGYSWEMRDEWLKTLCGQDVRLFVIPQVAAEVAKKAPQSINAWQAYGGLPTWHAMLLMEHFATDLEQQGRLLDVVVLPEKLAVLARAYMPDESIKLLIHRGEPVEKAEGLVPYASVLFAALVAMLEGTTGNVRTSEGLGHAIAYTRDWMKRQHDRFEKPAAWLPAKPDDPLQRGNGAGTPVPGLSSISWKEELERWENARKDLGVVDDAGRKEIQLWRAMTDVDGYICLVSKKRESVRRVKQELISFARGDHKRHVSMMLVAPPGTGKTSLLEKLAKVADLELMEFNITHMMERGDILDCFDQIVSRQSAHPPPRPILAFFDEINAEIGGSDVYGAFLDPINRGTYTRGGKAFYIRPCAWVFAGTERPKSRSESHKNKASDFLSRLTVDPLEFKVPADGDQAKLERVYLGAALLLERRQIALVTRHVLDAFHLFPADASVRDLERFVDHFPYPREGRVAGEDVPTEWIVTTSRSATDSRGTAGSQGRSDERAEQPGENDSGREDPIDIWREGVGQGGDREEVRIVRTPRLNGG